MKNKLIIAPKREARANLGDDWSKKLREVEGVVVMGEGPLRIQVEATSGAVKKLHHILGDEFIIEAAEEHSILPDSISKT